MEWSFVRSLTGRPRRLSGFFLTLERAKLATYRREMRNIRAVQLAGSSSPVEVGAHDSMQMAVGQRVTALHPKERHLFTGTVLTPDGSHYRIQFDRQKHGVQLIDDVLVMPLLDGSRGIDFTSPRGLGLHDFASPSDHQKPDGGALLACPAARQGSVEVQADWMELQLVRRLSSCSIPTLRTYSR